MKQILFLLLSVYSIVALGQQGHIDPNVDPITEVYRDPFEGLHKCGSDMSQFDVFDTEEYRIAIDSGASEFEAKMVLQNSGNRAAPPAPVDEISMAFHVFYNPDVTSINGATLPVPQFEEQWLDDAIENLNNSLFGTNIKFIKCRVNYINLKEYIGGIAPGVTLDVGGYKHLKMKAIHDEFKIDGVLNVYCSFLLTAQNPVYNSGWGAAAGPPNPIFSPPGYIEDPHIVTPWSRLYRAGAYGFIHEVGHVLHLPHTFLSTSGTDELVTRDPSQGANCYLKGDRFCDTPADPYTPLYIDDADATCTYAGLVRDANNHLYTPDVKNIMSYTQCKEHFSYEQKLRMRAAYDKYQKPKWYQSCRCDDWVFDQQFGTVQVNGNHELLCDIVVKSGAKVRINNSDLTFHPWTRIIVEDGGYLELINCNLTGLPDETWKGVYLENSTSSIYNSNQYIGELAALNMRNTQITNAFVGVASRLNSVVTADYCMFKNNKVNLALHGSPVVSNDPSYFNECEFLMDFNQALMWGTLEQADHAGLNVFAQENWGVQVHAIGRSGTDFNSCTFQNESPVPSNYLNNGIGVLAYNSGLQFKSAGGLYPNKKNRFNDLSYGIVSKSYGTGLGSLTSIRDAEFNNVYRGIYLNSEIFGTIENCEINLTTGPSTGPDGGGYGVFAMNLSDFAIANNTINGAGYIIDGTETAHGIVIDGSSFWIDIRGNSISNVATQLQTQGVNDDLYFKCNTFKDYSQAVLVNPEFFIFGSNPISGQSYLPAQGSGCVINPQEWQTYNNFEDACVGGSNQLRTSVPLFYVSAGNNIKRLDDNCTNLLPVTEHRTCFGGNVNSCEVYQNIIPDAMPKANSGGGKPSLWKKFIKELDAIENEFDRRLIVGRFVRFLLQEKQPELAEEFLTSELGNSNDVAMKKLLARLQMEVGNYSASAQSLATLSSTKKEDQFYKRYYSLLLNLKQNQIPSENMSIAQKVELESIQNSNTSIAFAAENLIETFGLQKQLHNPFYLNIQPASTLRKKKSLDNDVLNEGYKQFVSLSGNPNPVNDRLFVQYEVESSVNDLQLVIFDVFGRELRSISIDASRKSIELDNLEKGLLLISLKSNNQYLKSIKVISQ